MIDIHTHILPCVDDGADSFETALNMIELEINDDVDEIILTPHYFNNGLSFTDWNKVVNQYEILKEKCQEKRIKISLGAEIYYTKEILNEAIHNRIITLNGTKFILIEFSLIQNYYDIPLIIDELIYLGYKPILAHAERYSYLSIKDIMNIKKSGGFIQVNTTSINGGFGKQIQRKVKTMFKCNCVDFISTDCHNEKVRKPNLKATLNFVKKKYNLEFNNDIYEK